MMAHYQKIYIAGPMRGYPRFNFDAFHAAEEALQAAGWSPINPAAMDEEAGFDPDRDTVTKEMTRAFIKRDLLAILESDCLALLPGWDRSQGALAELAVAQWLQLPVYIYPSMTLLEEEDILDEAARITKGDRNNSYGPPDQDFQRIAGMWSNLKEVEFDAREVAMFMICVKLSRETHQRKRDNWVDMAGYARCGSECR